FAAGLGDPSSLQFVEQLVGGVLGELLGLALDVALIGAAVRLGTDGDPDVPPAVGALARRGTSAAGHGAPQGAGSRSGSVSVRLATLARASIRMVWRIACFSASGTFGS